MGRWGDGEMGRWGDGEMGRWGDGEMGRWGDGEMGRWGDGEVGKCGECGGKENLCLPLLQHLPPLPHFLLAQCPMTND